MAVPWVDWRFASEIEPFPREVLRQRLGYLCPIWGEDGQFDDRSPRLEAFLTLRHHKMCKYLHQILTLRVFLCI